MRSSVLLACVGLALADSHRPAVAAPAGDVQRIAVTLDGPLATVQVTRTVASAHARGDCENVLDVALPERSALLSVEIGEAGRWRPVEAVPSDRARQGYAAALQSYCATAARTPFDESATHRIQVARRTAKVGAPIAPLTLRYRFSALADYSHGRQRLRFPASPEATPPPAEISVSAAGVTNLEIAGVHARLASPGGARATARGQATTRSGWEISFTPALPPAAPGGAGHGEIDAVAAVARLSDNESAIAFSIHRGSDRTATRPESVLFLVDRSRSVGVAGLAAERDVAARVLDLYPPSTRFDVLFFDRAVLRLFPMSRPATREAMSALDAEMVPDRLVNGTDLAGAMRAAGELLRREGSVWGPRTLLVVITDGALAEEQTGAVLDGALGAIPDLDLSVALIAVRTDDDAAVGPAGRVAMRAIAESRGGVERELRAGQINDAVGALLADLSGGGDVFSPRLRAGGAAARLTTALAPGAGLTGVVRVAGKLPQKGEVVAGVRGRTVSLPVRLVNVAPADLRPHASPGTTYPDPSRFVEAPGLAAMVMPVVRPLEPAPPRQAQGAMDRGVVRNTLSLAFMPRARACYQGRSGSTAAERDLTGKVRMAIDLVRGEVVDAHVESSTLNRPVIESCLRDAAFALDVPRAYRNDEPVTAIVNLVFRPRTPEKRPHSAEDTYPVGAEIDLILEELHKSESPPSRPRRVPR